MSTPQPPQRQNTPPGQMPPPSPFDKPTAQPTTPPPGAPQQAPVAHQAPSPAQAPQPPQQAPPGPPQGQPGQPPGQPGQPSGPPPGQMGTQAGGEQPHPPQQPQFFPQQPEQHGGVGLPPCGVPGQNAGHHMGQHPGGQPYAPSQHVSKPHLGHALASEWTKIRSLRSTVWSLAAMFVVSVSIGMLVGLGFSTDSTMDLPMLLPGVFGLMFGQIGVMTLGVLVITSEYSSKMIRTTMTACPQRTRVLTAKAIVFFALSFVITLAATALTGLINLALLGGMDLGNSAPNEESAKAGELVANSGEWFGATVGASLYVALLGVLALSLGSLLRSAPAAITIMIGVVLMPVVVSFFLLMGGDRTYDASTTLREYSPLNGLSSLYRLSMVGDEEATGWPLLGLLGIVTLVMLTAAYVRLVKRDV